MRPAIISTALLALIGWTLLARPQRPAALEGFAPDSARDQLAWEQKFRAIPSPERLRENMRLLSAHPHPIGSPYNLKNRDWLLARFQEWGWDAHIETFDVLFPTPVERVVELIEPHRFVAQLQEPAFAEDPTSNQQAEQLPTYNAYSIDGDVTAPLVYVNHGIPEDYEELARRGISVKGAIVIARYGGSWRGIKPKVAAEHGAVGCLIYSDPRDDGYAEGDVFPLGPWRPPHGVQRGSVVDLALYPGDPLTPGTGATANAKRLDLKDVRVFTKIPVLPISYADAQPLLMAIGGAVAPPAWRGALGITYHIGPGPAKVHLRIKSDWSRKQIHNVIARISGSTAPDEWVIRGNHYDAWVNGAQDPVSALSAELEEARALGELRRAGWQPRRTIIYAAWDGEEAGLVGSTEWVETHADELRAHAVAYINSDTNSRGYLDAGGSQSFQTLLNQIAREIPDPETKVSIWQRRQTRRIAAASNAQERRELRRKTSWSIDPLGSGSDYAAFLDFAGIASINLGFSGETGGGIYHSAYDDFYWYTHFDDKDFVYGRALAQMAGTTVMRLAGADLLPLHFGDLAAAVRGYVTDIQSMAEKQRAEAQERSQQTADEPESAAAERSPGTKPVRLESVPPRLDFSAMENALTALEMNAARYQRAYAKANENGGVRLARASLASSNQKIWQAERALTDPNGLPDRPWYKHQLYAPGTYTGYSAKTIPSVREAIEQKKWTMAQQAIARAARLFLAEAAAIERAAADLELAVN